MTISNIAIIGGGQLGTRHMQSVVRNSRPSLIWLVDPDPSARSLAEVRLKEIGADSAAVHYRTSARDLPEQIDVAIIATSSGQRLAALQSLLEGRSVGAIVLEKFLFPRISDYAAASDLLAASATPAFVNCPRRMFRGYREINRELKGPVSIELRGGRWGLACNSIHWLDLLNFFRPEPELTIRSSLQGPVAAKRFGYIEFYGEIEIADRNGSCLHLVSHDDERPNMLRISDQTGLVWDVFEAQHYAVKGGRRLEFPIPVQSNLTASVVNKLRDLGTCDLVSYPHSAAMHMLLLNEFLGANTSNTHGLSDECSIT